MSATLESIEKSFTDQLTEFDEKIKAQEDNAELLNEIHSAITLLMAQSGDRDEDIREILEKRYNAGKLRLETFQLVRNVLDRVVIESMPTMPEALEDTDGEDSMAGETVLVDRSTGGDDSQHRLQIGTVLRDRFLLQQRVAGGSMGVVYKAHDRRLAEAEGFDPWVAIKVLSPKLSRNAHALRALQQEAAKGRCLSHPNIVRFIDLDRDDDIYFIVMEWLEGRSLAAILDENRNTRIDIATALDIVRQVGQALDYAHRCGVIHADVKPANIMLTATGQVKLFDFGIARIRQQQDRRHAFDPGVLGAVTPAYASPQMLRGEDPQATDDVYSLGCLMYRMVAGYRAFGPRNAVEAADQGLEPQRPDGLTETQWRALHTALAFSRSQRYGSVADFLEALDTEEKREEPIAAMPISDRIVVEPKRMPERSARPWGIATGLLVVAIVGLGSLLLVRPDLVDGIRGSTQDLLGPAELEELPAIEDDELPPAREPDFQVVPPGTTGGATEPDPSAGTGTSVGGTAQEPAGAAAPEPVPGAGGVGETPAGQVADTPPGEVSRTPSGELYEAPAGELSEPPAGSAAGPQPATQVPQGERPAQQPSADPAAAVPAEEREPAGVTAGDRAAAEDETRRLEASLPPDTVGFTTARLRVREGEPAVQIDVLRLNPSAGELDVRYDIVGGSATEGEDYFLPGATGLVFAPGQRSARLLIPLVQDATLESDETFMLELREGSNLPEHNLHRRIEVVIRDDDGAY